MKNSDKILSMLTDQKSAIRRNKILTRGVARLKLFLATTVAGSAFLILSLLYHLFVKPNTTVGFAWGTTYLTELLLFILLESILFWSGIIRVYTTSVQLGIKWRIVGIACGASSYVASLTTINTPHRGCIFADYLLDKIPEKVQKSVARKYNTTLKKFGDTNPDFLSAVRDLTASACAVRNEKLPNHPAVWYQSVGSQMNCASSGRFPLNMAYPLVRHFDGANDGLVSLESACWGDHFIRLAVPEGRGISHGDMIDLNRENIPGFDIREFYNMDMEQLLGRYGPNQGQKRACCTFEA